MLLGFPAGPVAKTVLPMQGPGFDPWAGNWIPHASTKSLHAIAKKKPYDFETTHAISK